MRIAFFFCAAIALLACGGQEKKSGAPYSFSIETFQHATNGCAEKSQPCASYEVSYPVFEGLDDRVRAALMSKIQSAVSMGNPEAGNWTLQQIAEDFVRGYEELIARDSSAAAMSWYYKANITVENQKDSLIVLSVRNESFTGGAHGSAGRYFININPVTGEDVTLAAVLKPGFEEALRQAGERAFRNFYNLADTSSLVDHGFEFPENRFELNRNYGFIKEGIAFFYNNYEIAAYAVGPTEIIVPYEEIRDWIRPSSPL